MSGELWAIVGVVVGAIIPGGIGLTQAILQRRWSVSDADHAADRTWEHEKRDRLFEAKRSAHAAFSDALGEAPEKAIHEVRSSRHLDQGSRSAEAANFAFTNGLMRLQAQVQIYGSAESAAAAKDAVVAVYAMSEPDTPRIPDSQIQAFHQTHDLYLRLMRIDLGVDSGEALDDLVSQLGEVRKLMRADWEQSELGT